MNKMQAIVMNQPGGPEVLELRSLPLPELSSARHVRVRLHAAGVNPVDTKLRANGTYYPDRLPTILGCDGAGVVEAVGDQVTRVQPGDKVYYCSGGIGGEPGNYATYNTVHEDYLARLPANLDFVQAAAVPLVLITAWEALYDRAHIQPAERILIHAAAGGVGHVAVQLARHTLARVAATVGDADKAAFVRALGAEHIIEYKQQDFVQAALDWTGGAGVDLTLDTVGGETFCKSFAATRVYGQVVTLLQTVCDANAMKTARNRNLGIHYELMLTPMFLGLHAARVHQREILEQGAQLIEAGKLKVQVSAVLPLADAAEAHRRIGAGHTTGKIVLRID
ncbi:MAG TPA: zinc-dependent alcohol dehydrogenase family protein [Acidiferrobacterales bacterium]|nr:zinc-dependent alcohol dehydrogenase family protein [Acidiferrobacterales bacterium]